MTDFDLAIINGTVVDGSGLPRVRADLGIRDGKIAAVATGESLSGRCVIDAAGMVVAPGFIDVHSHADLPPAGIKSVLISGQLVAEDGRLVNLKRFGRVLRR